MYMIQYQHLQVGVLMFSTLRKDAEFLFLHPFRIHRRKPLKKVLVFQRVWGCRFIPDFIMGTVPLP